MTKLPHGLHCALGRTRSPQAKARRNERDRAQRRANNETLAALRAAGLMPAAYSRTPPDCVLEEARAAISAGPRDTTAAVCGDPLPGRSALDRKNLSP